MLQANVYVRIFFAAAMLLLAIQNHGVWISILMILLLVVALRHLHGNYERLVRIMKLLRWFIVPILLIHAFFTPGERVLDMPVPLTKEGLGQGVWICLHFISMFLAAMLLGALIQIREWLVAVASIPFLQRYVWAYSLMLGMMSRSISRLLVDINKQWKLRKKWRHAPVMLMGALRASMATGASQSRDVWLRWPTYKVWRQAGLNGCYRWREASGRNYILNIGLIIAGLMSFVLALQ